jgi:hypothetical protein
MQRSKKQKLLIPKKFEGLKGLPRAEQFEDTNAAKAHLEYYSYKKSNIGSLAKEYMVGKDERKKEYALSFIPTLVEIQKSRMDPALFESLEGKYYQWKQERVLRGPYIWNSDTRNDESSTGDNDDEDENDNDNDDGSNIGTETKDNENNKKESNNDSNDTEESKTNKDSLRYIRAGKVEINVLQLNKYRISLELKRGKDFVPWIYFKTVNVKGKKTIGMFAGRDFSYGVVIGFYISHPWFKWVEPFTVEPPDNYDAELQKKHLLPEEDASGYMWFYDDKGFMTACDPITAPPRQKGEPLDEPRKRIIGMGFHLVNDSKKRNIAVDDNGSIKTTMAIEIDTELVM